MDFSKRESLTGVALKKLGPEQTPVGKPCLLQGDKIVQVFEFGLGVFYDNFMKMVGIKSWRDEDPKGPCKRYQVSETISKSPKDDRYFAELRIWWNRGEGPEQEMSMFELVSAFIERENQWCRKLGNGRSAMNAIYGEEYIYTSISHEFALRKESGIRDGLYYEEFTIWSYPLLTQA